MNPEQFFMRLLLIISCLFSSHGESLACYSGKSSCDGTKCLNQVESTLEMENFPPTVCSNSYQETVKLEVKSIVKHELSLLHDDSQISEVEYFQSVDEFENLLFKDKLPIRAVEGEVFPLGSSRQYQEPYDDACYMTQVVVVVNLTNQKLVKSFQFRGCIYKAGTGCIPRYFKSESGKVSIASNSCGCTERACNENSAFISPSIVS